MTRGVEPRLSRVAKINGKNLIELAFLLIDVGRELIDNRTITDENLEVIGYVVGELNQTDNVLQDVYNVEVLS